MSKQFYSIEETVEEFLSKLSKKIRLKQIGEERVRESRTNLIRGCIEEAERGDKNYRWVKFTEKNGKLYIAKDNYLLFTEVVGTPTISKILEVSERTIFLMKKYGILQTVKKPLISRTMSFFRLTDLINDRLRDTLLARRKVKERPFSRADTTDDYTFPEEDTYKIVSSFVRGDREEDYSSLIDNRGDYLGELNFDRK